MKMRKTGRTVSFTDAVKTLLLSFLTAVVMLGAMPPSAGAQEWPQFRGVLAGAAGDDRDRWRCMVLRVESTDRGVT